MFLFIFFAGMSWFQGRNFCLFNSFLSGVVLVFKAHQLHQRAERFWEVGHPRRTTDLSRRQGEPHTQGQEAVGLHQVL